MEADAVTSAAGNNGWSIKREQTGSTGVREHGEHETVNHSVPGRPCISSKEYLPHKEHFIQGGRNGVQGVGFVIIPMKPVMTVEGRGGHINHS